MIQPVILSGGSGTRLWPLSREHYPKQLLPLAGEQSLLQQTVTRLDKSLQGVATEPRTARNDEISAPIIVCNDQHRFLVAEQLRQINHRARRIILEPVGRNTAPALTMAALGCDADEVMLVMPSDHLIRNTTALHRAIEQGYQLAKHNALVTFGIVPTHAEIGYGYIKTGEIIRQIPGTNASFEVPLYTLSSFIEKPDSDTAQQYLLSGDYLWNSGMFMMKASVWLAAIKQYRADIAAACEKAYTLGRDDLDFYRVDKKAFADCPSDSIDYAVMEHTVTDSLTQLQTGQSFGAVVPLDAGWSDVGAWSALWEVGDRDEEGNVTHGDVLTHQVSNSLVHAEHRLVASVGLNNIIIVETADAVLVAHKDHSQDVKHIVEALKQQDRPERIVHRKVYRPWGSYEGVDAGARFQVKRIIVNPGAALSLQMHHHRAEHWIVVRGTARVTRGDEQFLITENESTYIPLGVKHRLENPGNLPLEIIEVQSGGYLGEDDIVRFEDVYGREKE